MVKCFSEIRTESDNEFHKYIVKYAKISFKISFLVLKVLNSLFCPFLFLISRIRLVYLQITLASNFVWTL